MIACFFLGEVRILSSLHESGQYLDRLTGIAALLRFPMPELDMMCESEDEEEDNDGAGGGANGDVSDDDMENNGIEANPNH